MSSVLHNLSVDTITQMSTEDINKVLSVLSEIKGQVEQALTKREAVKLEALKQEAIKQEAIKQQAIKQEAIKLEVSRSRWNRFDNKRWLLTWVEDKSTSTSGLSLSGLLQSTTVCYDREIVTLVTFAFNESQVNKVKVVELPWSDIEYRRLANFLHGSTSISSEHYLATMNNLTSLSRQSSELAVDIRRTVHNIHTQPSW